MIGGAVKMRTSFYNCDYMNYEINNTESFKNIEVDTYNEYDIHVLVYRYIKSTPILQWFIKIEFI